jgi:phage terminase small subunit
MRRSIPLPEPYPDPPVDLSPESQELWREWGPRRASTSGRREVLAAALRLRDRASQCRQDIRTTGMTVMTESTKATHLNPSVKIEIESTRHYVALLRELGISSEDSILGGLL